MLGAVEMIADKICPFLNKYCIKEKCMSYRNIFGSNMCFLFRVVLRDEDDKK